MQGLFLLLCQNNILHLNHCILLPMYLLGESVFQLPAWFLYSGWNCSPYGENPKCAGERQVTEMAHENLNSQN